MNAQKSFLRNFAGISNELLAFCFLTLAVLSLYVPCLASTVSVKVFNSQTGARIFHGSIDVHSLNSDFYDVFDFENGADEISIPSDNYEFVVKAVGYKPLSKREFIEHEMLNWEFYLSPVDYETRLNPYRIIQLHKPDKTLINGFIMDSDGLPISDVRIELDNGKLLGESNNDGYFEFYLDFIPNYCLGQGLETIQFVKTGYINLKKTDIPTWPNGDMQFRIRLYDGIGSETDKVFVYHDIQQTRQPIDKSEFQKSIEQYRNQRGGGVISCNPTSITVGFTSNGGKCCSGCATWLSYPIQDYVKNVLPSEWLLGWSNLSNIKEAYKAGAVAIRTFGIFFALNPQTSNYDICSSACCQVFGSSTNSITNIAVDETDGWILWDHTEEAMSQFSSENNNLSGYHCVGGNVTANGCGDGKFGRSYTGSPCFSDPPGTGHIQYGHGKGMSQVGSARWASGLALGSWCQGSIYGNGSPSHGYGTKNWQEILNHYYSYYLLYDCNPTSSDDITVNNTSVSPTTVDCGNTVDVAADHVYSGSQLDAGLPSFNLDYYLSTDCSFGSGDVSLDNGETSSLGSDDPVHTETATLTIPPTTSSGTYYILFVGDADDELSESDESNNVACKQITVNCVNPPDDISVANISVTPTTVGAGCRVYLSADQVYSGSELDANLPSYDLDYYLSDDCNLGGDVLLGDDASTLGSDAPFDTEDDDPVIPEATPPGTYYILFVSDADDELSESNENNNIICIEITVPDMTRDITVNNVSSSPTTTSAGSDITLSSDLVYSGCQLVTDLTNFDLDYYLSTDCNFDVGDVLIGNEIGAVGSDSPVSPETTTVTIPAGTTSGPYYVLFVSDADNEMNETDENNNVACVLISVIDTTCVFSLSPSSDTVDRHGEQKTFNVNLSSGNNCSYAAATANSWITINSGSGTNSGTVTYTVDSCISQNEIRTGTITVQNIAFSVVQNCLINGLEHYSHFNSIEISPNPNTGSFIIHLQTHMEEEIQVSILNILGQEILSLPVEHIKGKYSKLIELKTVADGLYFVSVKTDKEFVNKKIIIRNQ